MNGNRAVKSIFRNCRRWKHLLIFHVTNWFSSRSSTPLWFNLYHVFVPLSFCLLCYIPHMPPSPSPISHLCSYALRYFGIQSFCDYVLVCIFDKSADDRWLHWNMKLVPRIREQTCLLGVLTCTHTSVPQTTSQPPQWTPPQQHYGIACFLASIG